MFTLLGVIAIWAELVLIWVLVWSGVTEGNELAETDKNDNDDGDKNDDDDDDDDDGLVVDVAIIWGDCKIVVSNGGLATDEKDSDELWDRSVKLVVSVRESNNLQTEQSNRVWFNFSSLASLFQDSRS